jgi:hypothetical protein
VKFKRNQTGDETMTATDLHPAMQMSQSKRIEAIAEQVGFSLIESYHSLYVKGAEFKIGRICKADAYAHQGWTLCVASLASIIGEGETSTEGTEEAAKIDAWMRSQN